jgi:hypothetical protein
LGIFAFFGDKNRINPGKAEKPLDSANDGGLCGWKMDGVFGSAYEPCLTVPGF